MLKLDNIKIVPEDIIEQCAKDMGDELNRFKILLYEADIFREESLTPIFLCSSDMKYIFTTSIEKMENKFH